LKVSERFEGGYLFYAGLLLGLFFEAEDGGGVFLRNVG
jgi:hypothetical protein